MALGETLRRKRTDLGLTISQVAGSTQIKAQTIEDIEKEDFRRISAPIYGKGFIKLYAEHLGLDSVPLVNEYANRFANSRTPSIVSEQPPRGATRIETVKSEAVKTPPISQAPLPPVKEDIPVKTKTVTEEKPREVVKEEPRKDQNGPTAAQVLADKSVKSAKAVGSFFSDMAGGIEKSLANLRSVTDRMWSWQPKFSADDMNGKNISIALGVLIVIIFVASSVSQCGKKREILDTETAKQPTKDLDVAFEPPEPYVD